MKKCIYHNLWVIFFLANFGVEFDGLLVEEQRWAWLELLGPWVGGHLCAEEGALAGLWVGGENRANAGLSGCQNAKKHIGYMVSDPLGHVQGMLKGGHRVAGWHRLAGGHRLIGGHRLAGDSHRDEAAGARHRLDAGHTVEGSGDELAGVESWVRGEGWIAWIPRHYADVETFW